MAARWNSDSQSRWGHHGREKIIHRMKEHELDILTLQETRVNVNSVEQPTVEQLRSYNDHVQGMLQAYNNIDQSDAFQIWAKVIHTAANETFTRVPPSQTKMYISEETWQLLQEKQAKTKTISEMRLRHWKGKSAGKCASTGGSASNTNLRK